VRIEIAKICEFRKKPTFSSFIIFISLKNMPFVLILILFPFKCQCNLI